MFVGNITNWTSVLNTDIPFTTVLNSNSKIANDNGTVSLKTGGYWNVDASINVTGVASDVAVTLYVDGVAKATTYGETTLGATTDNANVAIVDGIKTVLSGVQEFATVSLRVSVAGATVNGNIRIEYVQ